LLRFFFTQFDTAKNGRRRNMAVDVVVNAVIDAMANVAVTDMVAQPLIISHFTKTYVS